MAQESGSRMLCFTQSLKDSIIAGVYKPGQKIPTERQLAEQMGLSRTVVHAGIVELAAQGVLSVSPRQGTFVADYTRDGTAALLNALFSHRGAFDGHLADSIFAARRLIECECVRLACERASAQEIATLEQVVEQERGVADSDAPRAAALDFRFHHLLAVISGNAVYPLIINSMQVSYLSLAERFYRNIRHRQRVIGMHAAVCEALGRKDTARALAVCAEMLDDGEQRFSQQ